MTKFLTIGNKLAPWAIGALSAGVLIATVRAALQHQIGSFDSVLTAEIAVLALAFVTPVLFESRDRQTLSVYRAMRLRK